MSSGGPKYSPRFKVTVGGKTFQEGGTIADLVVETTVDGADRFSFTLNHGFDAEKRVFTNLDWNKFSSGTDVSIKMGRGGDGTLTPVAVGKIHSTETEFTHSQGPRINVTGYGKLYQSMQGTKSKSWKKNTSLGKIVKEAIGSYFGTVKVGDAQLTFKEPVFQDQQSDYRFVSELAETYGFDFFAERDTVYFKPRSSIAGSGGPVATLVFGENLQSFTAEIKKTDQVDKVEVRYWDMNQEKDIVATASGGNSMGSGTKKEVFRIQAMSKKEAEEIANAKLNELSAGVVHGRGENDGNPAIVAGKTIKMKELAKKFEKKYYVTKATHRMGGSGYDTTFEATEVSS